MERRLRGIDVIGIILAGVCVLEAGVGLVLQPRFRVMFSDFGSALPPFTELALRPWTLVVAGLIPMVLVLGGVVSKRSEPGMVAICVVSIGAALGILIAFVVAMYLPIFGIATAIK